MLKSFNEQPISVQLYKVKDEENNQAELDEMWSFIGKKQEQRWLWYAIEKESKKVLAYVLGKRDDECAKKAWHFWHGGKSVWGKE